MPLSPNPSPPSISTNPPAALRSLPVGALVIWIACLEARLVDVGNGPVRPLIVESLRACRAELVRREMEP